MKRQNKLLACAALLSVSMPAYAQQGNFFGGGGGATPPGAVGGLENEGDNGAGPATPSKSKSSSASPGMATGGSSGGDYTADEKRMQKKYKDNVAHAKSLIEKGDSMMKNCKGNTSHKDYKKGKIWKEIGEKNLAELQSNNPFPEPEKPVKATTNNKKDGTKQEL